jgi:Nitrile hydratase beta subunit
MRNYHDMGGESAGPIDREEHPLEYWEKRVEALISVLASKKLTRSDEGRRALETLGADTYLASSYAERRIQALANNMILRGVISVEELAAKLAEVERRKEQLP